jgi:hypothetical protein
MANEILIHTSGTPLCWADPVQYAVGVYGQGNLFPKTHNIALKTLAANAAVQADKADLGVKRAQGYVVKAAVEFAAAPTAGGPVEFYWSASPSSHPASGNAGGGTTTAPYVSGVYGAYAPVTGSETDIDEWKQHLQFVGVLGATNDGAGYIQSKVINSYFTPSERYGQFVVKNDASQAFATGGSGMYIALIPVTDEIA